MSQSLAVTQLTVFVLLALSHRLSIKKKPSVSVSITIYSTHLTQSRCICRSLQRQKQHRTFLARRLRSWRCGFFPIYSASYTRERVYIYIHIYTIVSSASKASLAGEGMCGYVEYLLRVWLCTCCMQARAYPLYILYVCVGRSIFHTYRFEPFVRYF